jgi:uncharacterized membrane protein YfcA
MAIGFASGLLANGGGFLLVPLFLLVLGLDLNSAAGTSLVCAATLTVPTRVTHAALGESDWRVAVGVGVGWGIVELVGAQGGVAPARVRDYVATLAEAVHGARQARQA